MFGTTDIINWIRTPLTGFATYIINWIRTPLTVFGTTDIIKWIRTPLTGFGTDIINFKDNNWEMEKKIGTILQKPYNIMQQ